MLDEEQERDPQTGDPARAPVLRLAGVEDEPGESHIVRGVD
ncbi:MULTISPECIES: hypothetical protein [unclassified Streptomyces]